MRLGLVQRSGARAQEPAPLTMTFRCLQNREKSNLQKSEGVTVRLFRLSIIFVGMLVCFSGHLYAGAFADSVTCTWSCYAADSAVGAPDGKCAILSLAFNEHPGNGLILRWIGSLSDSEFVRFRLYMGPDTQNNDFLIYGIYQDKYLYGNTLGQGYDWEVIYTPNLPSFDQQGNKIDGIFLEKKYIPYGHGALYVDAVEIIDTEPLGTYEIISARFDKEVYQSGVDTGLLTVATLNNSHFSEDFEVYAYLSSPVSETIVMGPDSITMGAGQAHVSRFNWPVPSDTVAIPWDLNVDLYSQGSLVASYSRSQAIITTPLSLAQINNYKNDIEQCWLEANQDILRGICDVVPLASNDPQASAFVSTMCLAGQLYQLDRKGISWSAFGSGMLKFYSTAVDLFMMKLSGSAPILFFFEPIRYIEKIFGVEILSPENPSALIMGDIRASSNERALVDSLALWIPAGFDSAQGEYSNALLIEGQCKVMFEADSIWARADSTGLNAVLFASFDTVGSATIISKNVHAIKNTKLSNPHSAGVFRIDNCGVSVLDIGLLYHNASDSLIFYRYPYVSVTNQTMLSIEVADTLDIIVIQCDYNGDGQIDYIIYPSGTTDVDTPDIPSLSSLILYQNIPNPFNPTTTIKFDLPRSEHVNLSVFNVKGERIVTLLNQHMPMGRNEVSWNAQDNRGNTVASGIYFYRIVAGDFVQTKKMVLLR